MSAFGGLTITNRGKILQSKAQTGIELHYTRIALGDGYLGTGSILDLNALRHQVLSLDITKLKASPDGTATIGTVFTNQNITTGFFYREVGIFATDPDVGEILYCYGNAGDLAEYIPAGGSDLIEKNIELLVLIGNASNVTATINNSLVYATLEDAQEMADQAEANAKTYSDTNLNTHITDNVKHITATERSNWNNKAEKAAATQAANGLMSASDKKKLDGVDDNANNYVHPATHPASMITGLSTVATSGSYNDLSNKPTLGTVVSKNTGTTSGNIPIIGPDNKLDSSIMPALAITDTFVVNSQAAMLALTAQVGDVCVRTDLTKSYILKVEPATTLANWQELLSPPNAVISVNGKTGAVTLNYSDVGAEPSFNKNTAFNKNFGTTAGTVSEGNHTHTKSDIGLGNVDNVQQAPKTDFESHKAEKASLTQVGHVQLTDSITSTSTTTAATPNSVKTVTDKAQMFKLTQDNGNVVVASGDLNNLKTLGFYHVGSAVTANKPISDSGHLIVMQGASSEEFTHIYKAQNSGRLFMRTYTGGSTGTWQAWTELATLDSNGDLPLNSGDNILNWVKGYGLGDQASPLTASFDLNNLDGTGFYKGSNLKNTPTVSSGVWFYVIHLKHAPTYMHQMAFSLDISQTNVYTRIKNNGTWSAWTQLETTAGSQAKAEQVSLKINKSGKDANGVFTTVEYRRKSDNTLAQKSVFSGGTSPQYTTETVTYYGTDGTTVVKTDTFTLTYDSDGDLIGRN